MRRWKKIDTVCLSGILILFAFMFYWLDSGFWKDIALIAATVVAGWSIANQAIQSLLLKSFSIELLVTIAVIGAIIIGEYVESASVTFLFLFGAYLEVRSLEKTRSSLQTLMDLTPLQATVKKGNETRILSIGEIRAGDCIIIQSGEKVAADGRVIAGQAYINEAAITGESTPSSKCIGDHVFSGTMVDNGYLEVITERVGEDTSFAKMIALVEEAQETKARTQKFLERFANVYTPGILILAIMVFLLTRNIEMTLTFLVIACPGALVISAPVSLVAGIGNGARHAALIKGGEIMENLAKIDIVVFDKTGTLTEGKPSVTNIRSFDMDEKELLQIAAEAEWISEHHLGRAIVNEAKERGIKFTNKPVNFSIDKGHGLQAVVAGDDVVIGNRKILAKHDIQLSKTIHGEAQLLERLGNTVVFIAINHTVKGVIAIADQIRPQAVDTIQQLKTAGVKKILMLTGDNKQTAEMAAEKLGMDAVVADMLPEDKINHVKQMQDSGYKIAMVGDGINDAPAIAQADVGIAMGAAGTDAAMETADIVLMTDELDRIPYAFNLAKTTIKNMKQNMLFAVATVVLLLFGVLTGKVFLASGMFIHELSVLAVICNALRLVHYNKLHKEPRGISEGVPEVN